MFLKRLYIVLIVIFTLLCNEVWAQDEVPDYNFISIKDGISKVGVFSLIQDSYGFIWIGTNGAGLHRYNGVDYTTYLNKLNDTTSISSNMISCSYLDSKKRLWFGTESGLDLYNRDLDQFDRIKLHPSNKENNGIKEVTALIEDGKGNLIIGTLENGVYKLSLNDFSVKKIPFLNPKLDNGSLYIMSLQKTSSGKIYAGTTQGLFALNSNNENLKLADFHIHNVSRIIKDNIHSLLIDKEDNIWVGTVENGLYKINDSDTNKLFNHLPITKNRIRALLQVSDNTYLCGTENDGLILINLEGVVLKKYLHKKTEENSLLSNSIWALYLDKNERIWVGFYGKGVAVHDRLYDKFQNFESISTNVNSLESSSVTGIAQDNLGRFWFSTDGGGIDVFNPKTNTFTKINKNNKEYVDGLTSDYLQTIFIDSKQNVWVGSWKNGLFLLKNNTKKFINYTKENTTNGTWSNSILSFAEDSKGIIWMGSHYGGLVSFNPDTQKFTHHDSKPFLEKNFQSLFTRKLIVDVNDQIWIGSSKGLYKVSIKDDVYTIESLDGLMVAATKKGIASNHILSIYECSNGFIWTGTKGLGLFKINPNNNDVLWYNSADIGLINVAGITEDQNGNIWLSGNSGILKLDVLTNKIVKYTSDDGLLSNDFNLNASFTDNDGTIFLGNYRGVDYFNPEEIEFNKIEPPVYLTNFRLFNKPMNLNQKNSPLTKVISETESIVLTNNQSVFTIDYVNVNFTRPEKNQYAYYLEGFESDWNYVGNKRSATYTNLPHGNYVFKVKSSNNDAVWNETPLELNIVVLPPWWKTKWALFLYLILFFLGIYLTFLLMRQRLEEKQLVQSERAKRIHEEELNNKKLRFFTNITHEFRTPLTLIINPLENVIRAKNLSLPKDISLKLQTVHKNTLKLSRLITELMDFRKLEMNKTRVKAKKIELIHYINNITSYFKEESLSKDIFLNVESNVSSLQVWADPYMLEKIIFNILSNAFKATPEGGSIVVRISLKKKNELLPLINEHEPVQVYEISIKDTGQGIKKEELSKIFDRFYQIQSLNKSYYGGTGIGLEVVRNFIELHRGKIEVESALNKGTIFRVIFAMGKSYLGEDEIIRQEKVTTALKKEKFEYPDLKSDSISEDDNEFLKPYTVLIVEDEPDLRNYLKEELSDTYEVLTANNGAKGFEIANKRVPDIIVSDIIMPEMNGFDLCAQIKKDLRTSHIPVLLLTTKTMTEDWVEGIESGADAYMNKPFNMRVLKSRLMQLVTNRQLLFNKYFNGISEISTNQNTSVIDKEFIQKVLNYMGENLHDPELGVETLANQFKLSRSQFYRKIKSLTGQTANSFLRKIRLQKAKLIIENGNTNISEVSYNTGFSSPSYFTKCFKDEFGILPTEVCDNF
ncbi:MAG: hybrid sensor histidine kinase/response regulator [Flavobacteriaceae bacterium]|nr:MAG: hybrid sensor histidine kinase/response regulator [Flavobacteriaceae bacterium]